MGKPTDSLRDAGRRWLGYVLMLGVVLIFSVPAFSGEGNENWIAKRDSGSAGRSLSPEERERLREWESLPSEKQNQLRNRMNQWKEMPSGEQDLYRKRFQQWQQLSPNEKEKLRRQLEDWNRLPPQDRDNIRRRFRD